MLVFVFEDVVDVDVGCGFPAGAAPLTVEPSSDSNALWRSAGAGLPEPTEEPEPCVTEERGVGGAELLFACETEMGCCCCCCVRKGFMLEAAVAGGVVSFDCDMVDEDWGLGLILRKRESRDLGGVDGAGSR